MTWSEELKTAWKHNIPYVVAYMTDLRARMDLSTPEGQYNVTLAKTDDEEAARRAMNDATVAIMKAQLSHATLPGTV